MTGSSTNEDLFKVNKRGLDGSSSENKSDPIADNMSAQEPLAKKAKVEDSPSDSKAADQKQDGRKKGVAPIKEEYLIKITGDEKQVNVIDDDAAEGRTAPKPDQSARDGRSNSGKRDRKDKKNRGQNTERDFGRSQDSSPLCNSRAFTAEFSPRDCKFGDGCRSLHDLRKYLKEGRRADLDTLGRVCPSFVAYGKCSSGWRCRFIGSHMKEVERDDGRKELVLVEDDSNPLSKTEGNPGVVNAVSFQDRVKLERRKLELRKAEMYANWTTEDSELHRQCFHAPKGTNDEGSAREQQVKDYRAKYVEPPLKPSEKRKLYFGRETPVLAPLTTQGNLPFRRLCVELGAQATYSEMALSLPLLQGTPSDWALMKAHRTELTPPKCSAEAQVLAGYDSSRDIKFGAQIAANGPGFAIRATEALSIMLPHLRLIDLNCGCPIDMLYNSGAGSALLDAQAKLDKMIRGMNAVSGEIPITTKIRMGVRDDQPNARKLVERLAFGVSDMRDLTGPSGCAAVTLHGRSRQQRYTKAANWSYIAECAAMLESYGKKKDQLADTAAEPDESMLPNGGRMYFLGNGDVYSHVDYFSHLDEARVDAVMIGRGAIIKPWIFEEIEKGQYLDKSASERLAYVEKYARYGLEAWGSDEMGIGMTRRFVLDFLSFFHRYVPIGLLEHLPPSMNDRPPRYRGRNDLETLLASGNVKDWVTISEMFLGPSHPDFKFVPKHKSNSYDAEG